MRRKIIVSAILFVFSVAMLVSCRAAKTVQIIINSEPQGATVFIDGDVIGQTPIKRDITFKNPKKERRLIQIKKEGYKPQQRYFLYRDSPNQLFQLDEE